MNIDRDNKPRVLLVDDEPVNIKILADGLKADFAITVATSGKEALRLLSGSSRPDIILLDVLMPEMDGFEVCERLKADEQTAHIPVIFVTGLNDPISEEYGLKVGAVDYIFKPISPSVVQLRLKLHLEHKMYSDFVQRLLTDSGQDIEAVRAEARQLFQLA